MQTTLVMAPTLASKPRAQLAQASQRHAELMWPASPTVAVLRPVPATASVPLAPFVTQAVTRVWPNAPLVLARRPAAGLRMPVWLRATARQPAMVTVNVPMELSATAPVLALPNAPLALEHLHLAPGPTPVSPLGTVIRFAVTTLSVQLVLHVIFILALQICLSA